MVQQNQPTKKRKSKMDKQRESNVKFLKSIPSVISGAFKGEYSSAAAQKKKKAAAKRKEEIARRRKALMKEKIAKAEKETKKNSKAAKNRASEFSSALSDKIKREKEGAGIKTATRTVSNVGAKKTKKTGTKSVTVSDAQKKGQLGIKAKKDLGPKGSVPKSVSAAQKAGKLYFMDKNNKPKLAITSAQLKQFQKKHGITSYSKALTKFANMYKPGAGMAKFKADMKKMAMGGAAMKMPSASQTGLKKLPSSVRNRMGYMMGGGMPKKSHGKAGGKSYGK